MPPRDTFGFATGRPCVDIRPAGFPYHLRFLIDVPNDGYELLVSRQTATGLPLVYGGGYRHMTVLYGLWTHTVRTASMDIEWPGKSTLETVAVGVVASNFALPQGFHGYLCGALISRMRSSLLIDYHGNLVRLT